MLVFFAYLVPLWDLEEPAFVIKKGKLQSIAGNGTELLLISITYLFFQLQLCYDWLDRINNGKMET